MKSTTSSSSQSSSNEKRVLSAPPETHSPRLAAEKAIQSFENMTESLPASELEEVFIRLIVRRGF